MIDGVAWALDVARGRAAFELLHVCVLRPWALASAVLLRLMESGRGPCAVGWVYEASERCLCEKLGHRVVREEKVRSGEQAF